MRHVRPTVLAGLALALTAGLVGPSAAAAGADLTLTKVIGGLDRPVLVTNDGSAARRLFIAEQSGRIRVIRFANGGWHKAGVFLDLHAKVSDPATAGAEQGLLGLAFDPDHATNGRFYVDYTRRASGSRDGDTVIAEYHRTSALRADPASGRTVRVIDQPYDNHNGGQLAFGPDGSLYIGLGDGGSGGDPHGNGQDLATPLGKILRIDPADPDGSGPKRYGIPAENPYIGETEKDQAIWASGLRNPWRFSFDTGTGDLVIGDVGQDAREEIDWLPATAGHDAGKGANLGWNVCEGDRTYPGGGSCDHAGLGFTAPVFDYTHAAGGPADGGCSVVGGYVFRAADAAAWDGLYVFGDFCSGAVSVLDAAGTRLLTVDTGRTISSFGTDAAGHVFLVDLGGSVWRVRTTGDPTP